MTLSPILRLFEPLFRFGVGISPVRDQYSFILPYFIPTVIQMQSLHIDLYVIFHSF